MKKILAISFLVFLLVAGVGGWHLFRPLPFLPDLRPLVGLPSGGSDMPTGLDESKGPEADGGDLPNDTEAPDESRDDETPKKTEIPAKTGDGDASKPDGAGDEPAEGEDGEGEPALPPAPPVISDEGESGEDGFTVEVFREKAGAGDAESQGPIEAEDETEPLGEMTPP